MNLNKLFFAALALSGMSAHASVCVSQGTDSNSKTVAFKAVPGHSNMEYYEYNYSELGVVRFEYEEGQNKVTLTVIKNGDIVAKTYGYIPDPGTSNFMGLSYKPEANLEAATVECSPSSPK